MDDQKFPSIKKPTATIDREQAKKNIGVMAKKAASQNIRFRPHFKTHQSAAIGEWFREAGVDAITVSSVQMAEYFAKHGWKDILIAFPANLREISEMNELASSVSLSLLAESLLVVEELDKKLENKVKVWVKVDTGMHRAGIQWEKKIEIEALCRKIKVSENLNLAGLLSHAGQTYHAGSTDEIINFYTESNQRLIELKQDLHKELGLDIQISVGDTPGCWLSDDLGEVDEIRPGNFLLFDAMMLGLGVCQPQDVALAVACPVVAKHADRNEVVIYGGAIHLSKEFLLRDDQPVYGYALMLKEKGWDFFAHDNFVVSLSQEHGVVKLTNEVFEQIAIGELLGVMPVHSCLVVDTLGYLVDLEGNCYETMRTG